ncbi:DNA recombination protein RecN [Campylobacter sp. RM10532]|uniref:AAA family ATPase n=1 Tax=Campylobacter molothri TaxID=1032242 RepID=UPI001DB872E5|nr:DNA recombination protein RecN [Campylobacter sp. RM12910]MBZ7933222.1 DNA recombination protein RecN [Campylobacter sp. RM10543]MBZ7945517.1 DNA recombination protein RecN [Campylobacter sp. RM10532]MBZ7946876.1 DNA recombination protein RecN [Campylobacter sp. RM10536]MBZ7948405.1 DNA recombination protein RecN [Campylobacter sp. RM9929]MBZ7952800.1 DNA recombination protein RecN [Campylobacter sp. RM9939]MBZ7957250.1 DNA recombination protein RecN [Campylobacter sp. RM10541]MBZ7960243.
MINRIFIKENLGFKEAKLEISKGLTVFTGLSGAGKSILFKGILSAFAISDSEARIVELGLDDKLNLEEYGIESEEENVFKLLKEKNTKYFINNQSIAKKSLQNLSKSFIKYLSAKENNEFSNEKFLRILDALEIQNNPQFENFLSEFKEDFNNYTRLSEELNQILDEERKIEELKEVAKIQIEKIQSINPKIGEYEELLILKKKLSKKDKLDEAWQKASVIFDLEKIVIDALNLSEKDPTFFSECLNELRLILESQKIEDFDFDIEKILDRIENLSFLMKRYGSIENALEILKQKKQELEHYENLSFEKKELEKKFEKAKDKLEKSTKILTQTRINNLEKLQNCLNEYLKNLYMKDAILSLDESKVISSMGKDEINLNINFANLKNLSSGELNRLRLAFIATECKILGQGSGILFLDEIDANLSGKEAMSIAMVLDELSNFYQIFAISHLPQLSSRAHNHFLVEKKGDESFVKKLNQEERIKELARMVSGEKINEEAIEFAKTLFKS